MSTVDIIELALKGCGMVIQKTRLDIRMGFSILIKFIFFGLWFYESGDSKYFGGHFATTLLTWVVFHLYILVIEKSYIVKGENDIKMRRKSYKIIDIIQSGILLIYFSIQVYVENNQEVFYNISVISLSADIALNFDQYLKFVEKQKLISSRIVIEQCMQGDEESKVTGGEITLYISMMIGAGLAMGMAVIMQLELSTKPELQTFPFYQWTLTLCAIGEGVFIFFIGYYLLPKTGEQIDQTIRENSRDYLRCSPTKHFLCLMYGLCIGFFSLYYAFFLGLYALFKIIQKVLEAIGWIAKHSQAQVHPQN